MLFRALHFARATHQLEVKLVNVQFQWHVDDVVLHMSILLWYVPMTPYPINIPVYTGMLHLTQYIPMLHLTQLYYTLPTPYLEVFLFSVKIWLCNCISHDLSKVIGKAVSSFGKHYYLILLLVHRLSKTIQSQMPLTSSTCPPCTPSFKHATPCAFNNATPYLHQGTAQDSKDLNSKVCA